MSETGRLYRLFRRSFPFLVVLMAALLISSCGTNGQVDYKSSSAGKADEVLWVMNDDFWADTIGATVKRRFLRSYDVLPQPEPEYQLRQKNFNQFNNDIIKKYRAIVLCATRATDLEYGLIRQLIDDAGEPYASVVFLENVWAKPQFLILISSDDEKGLLKVLQEKGREIEDYLHASEEQRTEILMYENEKNKEATDLLTGKYGFSMDIPFDYYIAADNRDFTWLRKETVTLSSNILVYQRKLELGEFSESTRWDEYAIQIREYLGQTYISSGVENSYMEIEDRFAPVLQDSTEILSYPGIRTRGLWRIEGDFMGGPFVNYAWFQPADTTFYMIDFFVHAPKEGKKKYMRHLEYVYGTLRARNE